MGSHLRVKIATETEPAFQRGALRPGRRRHQIGRRYHPGGFSYSQVVEHEVLGASRPSRMQNAAFFTNEPVSTCLECQPAGRLEIIGAPQNPPYVAIRSKCLLMIDGYAYFMGQVRSDSGAPK